MEREIKFRYRYTDGKNWIMKVFTLEEIVNGGPFEVLSDNPLLKRYKHVGQDQFIELQDANGVEVYEGDILQNKIDKGLLNWLVEFKNGCFVVVNIGSDGYLGRRFPIDHTIFFDRVIIGNRFQNPELLKQ